MSPTVQPNRTESDANPGWRKMAESIAAAIGWSFLFGFVYLFVNLAFGVGSESELRSMIRTEGWSDESLALLMMVYGFSFACLFGVYGYFAAKATGRRLLFHLATALPLTLLGIVIWILSDRSVKGLQAEFGGVSWLVYMVFAYWATPLFEYARHYVPGFLMKYAALSASFVPGLAAVTGAWLHLAVREPRLKKRMLAAVSLLPCLLLASLAVSLYIPRSTLFTIETYPKVDGATAALPFGKVLAHELAGLNRPQTERFVSFNTTHNAYVNLITKKADIIFAAGPSDEEMRLAEQNGVKLKLTPIGKDAFIFLI